MKNVIFTGSVNENQQFVPIVAAHKSHLDKTDSSRLFTETLSAKVEPVFADETGLVSAEAAGVNS